MFNYARYEAVWGNEGVAPCFLKFNSTYFVLKQRTRTKTLM